MRTVFVSALALLTLVACSGAEHGQTLKPQATAVPEAAPQVVAARALTACTQTARALPTSAGVENLHAAAGQVIVVCSDGKDAMKAAAAPDDCLAAADSHHLAAMLAWEVKEIAGFAPVAEQLARADEAAAACQLALTQAA